MPPGQSNGLGICFCMAQYWSTRCIYIIFPPQEFQNWCHVFYARRQLIRSSFHVVMWSCAVSVQFEQKSAQVAGKKFKGLWPFVCCVKRSKSHIRADHVVTTTAQRVVLNQTVLPAGFLAQLKENLLSSYMYFLSAFRYAHFCGYSDLTFVITVVSIPVHCLFYTATLHS